MKINIKQTEFILFVKDQLVSRDFYKKVLGINPSLDVPGMTEFDLGNNVKLGLMPNNGIYKILEQVTPHPKTGVGIPRCELYLIIDNINECFNNALNNGARLVSPVMDRDWGDRVGYFSDPDGHIIAFAQKI